MKSSKKLPLPLSNRQETMTTFITEDGSPTLYDSQLGTHYRSTQGAKNESYHVFIKGTRLSSRPAPWHILEMGFGTALNFLQTAQLFLKLFPTETLVYYAIDWNPITPQIFSQLQYEKLNFPPQLLKLVRDLLTKTTQETQTTITSHDQRIQITLFHSAWEDVILPNETKIDALFHDPFAPDINPEAWNKNYFQWAFSLLANDGLLATYSASTSVRMAMVDAGFYIAKTRGSGRKREMTIASPNPSNLSTFQLLKRDYYLKRIKAKEQ